MRLALVSHEYPPHFGGGIGTYAALTSRLLANAGHEVHVITNRFRFGSHDPLHRLDVHRDGNLWIHRLPALRDDWSPAAPFDRPDRIEWRLFSQWSPYLYWAEQVSQYLEALCGRHEIDVIEVPECAAEGYLLLRRRVSGLAFAQQAIVVTLHSPIREIHEQNLLPTDTVDFLRRDAMETYCIRHADRLSSPSAALARRVRQRLSEGPALPPCDVVRLPMADPGALARTSAPDPAQGGLALLFVGRLEPRKSPRILVDAVLPLLEEFPALRVQFVGRDCHAGEAPGSMREFLLSRVPAQLRGRFIFPGALPREEVLARYRTSAVCVFPATWDNFPLSCVEAMALGACVVVSDGSGVSEIIEEGRTGRVFPAGDVGALTTILRELLSDRATAARLGAAAPQAVRDACDPTRVTIERVAFYERAIQARSTCVKTAPASSRRRIERSVTILLQQSENERERRETNASLERAALVASVRLQSIDLRNNAGERSLPSIESSFVFAIRAGETIDERCFAALFDAISLNPDAAWAGAWSLPMGSIQPLYAGFDGSDLPAHAAGMAPPHVLMRREALFRLDEESTARFFEEGSSPALMGGLASHGLPGIVLPKFLSTHQPRACLSAACNLETASWKACVKARWPWLAFLLRRARRCFR